MTAKCRTQSRQQKKCSDIYKHIIMSKDRSYLTYIINEYKHNLNRIHSASCQLLAYINYSQDHIQSLAQNINGL